MRFSAAITAERILPQRLAQRARPVLDRIDVALFAANEVGVAGRQSFVAFLIRMISAMIAFFSQVLLARWLGGFEYGIFVLVWVTMVIGGSMACLGVHTSIVRFVHEYIQCGEPGKLRGILVYSRLFALSMSTLLALAGCAGVWLLSTIIEPYYVIPFYLGFICLPMIALSDVLQGTSRAYSEVVAALAPVYLMRPVMILVMMVAALAAGLDATAETAMLAAIAATYATAVLQFVRVSRKAEAKVARLPRKYDPKLWISVSLPIFLVEGFFFLLTNADVLMVGYFMPPEDVAVYFATVKTLAVVHFVYFAVKAGVAHRYAQYAQAGQHDHLEAFARQTVAWTFWPSLAMGIAVLLVGEFLLDLFGEGFGSGYPLLFVLVAGVVARSAVGPAESVLTMSGHQNVCAVVFALALALNIGLNFILIPEFGLWGAATATAIAMVFEASALAITVRRRLGITMAVVFPASKRTGSV